MSDILSAMPEKDYGAGIDRLFALVTGDLHLHLQDDTASVTGWGAVFNALHLTRGIKTLHDAGCCASVPPLLRSLLEYTMGALWLADAREDAVDVLARGMLYSHGKLDQALRKSAAAKWRQLLPQEAVAQFESVLGTDLGKHPEQYLLAFAALLEEYGMAEWVPIYNVLSTWSHFSSAGSQRYFRLTPAAWEVSQMPVAGEVAPCLLMAFGLLLDAMAAFDRLTTARPWKDGLDDVAADFGFTINVPQRRTRT